MRSVLFVVVFFFSFYCCCCCLFSHTFSPLSLLQSYFQHSLWVTAVIEGDRDPCGDKTGDGFWRSWLVERDIGRGWFGTLGLPRVVTVENLTQHFAPDSTSVHLLTPPLPELEQLRNKKNSYSTTNILLSPNEVWSESSTPRDQSMELEMNISINDLISSSGGGGDVGIRLLWDDADREYTDVGVRDGTYLVGVDLWDQINGDSYVTNITSFDDMSSSDATTANNIDAAIDSCRNLCLSPPSNVSCTAWTLSGGKLCRLKEYAQHALQVSSDNGAFLPYHGGGASAKKVGSVVVSGYIHTKMIRFMSLYVDRTSTTVAVPVTNTNYTYPNFNYSKLLMVVLEEDNKEEMVKIHAFIDRSIVEVFAQNGRSVVTARVYPFHKSSNRVGMYRRGTGGGKTIQVQSFRAWKMNTALAKEEPEEEHKEDEMEETSKQQDSYLDSRDITNGIIMIEKIYTDQPYCAQLEMTTTSSSTSTFSTSSTMFTRWTCVITINNYVGKDGHSEGGDGEHVVSIYSDDYGQTWSNYTLIELAPPVNVPNAYAVIVASNPLSHLQRQHQKKQAKKQATIITNTRLYAVYNLNFNNITVGLNRNDLLGYFYMKSSDDGGVTWSNTRYKVPYPKTWIDINNKPFNGTSNMMWSVDHVKKRRDGTILFAFTKIGDFIQNPPEEVFVMASTNLLNAADPKDVSWIMLPEKLDHGVTCVEYYNCNKTVMEEGHALPMSTTKEERTVIMARTSMGYLASAKRDGQMQPIDDDSTTGVAQYWNNTLSGKQHHDAPSPPSPLSPSSSSPALVPLKNVTTEKGKIIRSGVKHPRGPFTPKMMSPGIWLMLYYNNPGGGWYGRDPYFLSCGREVVYEDGRFDILWSQPEIVLYDREYRGGTSGGGYPDFIFQREKRDAASMLPAVYITAAQKALPHPANSRVYLVQVEDDLVSSFCVLFSFFFFFFFFFIIYYF